MSVDGAERKKQRIDALSDKIREHGRNGIPINTVINWATRNQGLRETTVRENLRILESCKEIFFDGESKRFRHIDSKAL